MLAAVNLGRPAFGLALVGGFGVGMSVALIGAGMLALGAIRLGSRLAGGAHRLRHTWEHVMPVLAGGVITAVGLVLLINARPWTIA